jgi:hypothetical protein
MALQWEGQNISTIREATSDDEGYVDSGSCVVALADGTIRTVPRSEVITEAQQEEARLEAQKAEVETLPAEPPPVEPPPPETPGYLPGGPPA